jgi:hypothetical protein
MSEFCNFEGSILEVSKTYIHHFSILKITFFVITFFSKVLLRAKKVGHQISVSFEKFDVVQALLSFFLTLFQLTV